MKGKRNGRWIAGALAAACVLVVLCALVSPGGNLPSSTGSPVQVDVELSAQEGFQVDAASPTGSDSASGDAGEPPFGGLEYEPGVVLVTLPAGVSPANAVAAIAQDTGLEGLALADETDAAARAATAAETPLLVELSLPEGVSVEDATALISASPAIDAVQPNFVYHLNDVADFEQSMRDDLIAQNFIVQELVAQAAEKDTHVGEQWTLESIYVYNVDGTPSPSDAKYAWDDVQTAGAVTVAVIDEGFQVDHEDLKDNVVATYNATDKSTDVSEVSGQKGHGTHVAGIVAATAYNGKGVAGVSYNAGLLLIKGMNASGAFNSADLAGGMNYAVSRKSAYNVRVINMSVGGGTEAIKDDVLTRAIDNAVANGIVVVCSAGNSFTDSNGKTWTPPYTDYPADYKNVVSVINLQKNDSDPHNVSRNTSSNYNAPGTTESSMNSGKNISAPGTSIYSTYPTSYRSSGYGNNTGTSMAAPCVAGALALAFTVNPKLTADDATSLLYSTATDVKYSSGSEVAGEGWDIYTGYGEVNARGMVDSAAAYLSGETSVQVGKTIAFSIAGSGWVWVTSDSSVATVSNGTVTGVSGGQARITAARSMGFFGLWPVASQVVTVYDPSISPSAATATVGGTITLAMNCSQSGSWNWTSSDTGVATVTSSGTTVTVSGKKAGTATITATLNSNSNISTTAKVTVNALSLSNATVTWPSTYTYNGSAQKPTPTVKVGSATLIAGADFTVAYPSDCTNAGTKSVTITPGTSGRCTGSKSASYTINTASLSGATVVLSPSSYTYNDTAKAPAITVKVGSRTLTDGTDYAVSWPSDRANVGIYQVTVVGKGNYTGSKSASFTVAAGRVTVYRLYHTTDGEHFYTTSANERDQILSWGGWNDEGVAWVVPSTSNTPVYRLYDRNTGEHHYTTSAEERAIVLSWGNWNDEGIAWYSDDAQTMPVHRLQNSSNYPHAHHYTLSANERSRCINEWGWRSEGVGWYALAVQ